MYPILQEHIVIPMPPSSSYDIPLSKCDTLEKILGWIIQLSEKSWVTRDIILEFIETSLSHHGIDRPLV